MDTKVSSVMESCGGVTVGCGRLNPTQKTVPA